MATVTDSKGNITMLINRGDLTLESNQKALVQINPDGKVNWKKELVFNADEPKKGYALLLDKEEDINVIFYNSSMFYINDVLYNEYCVKNDPDSAWYYSGDSVFNYENYLEGYISWHGIISVGYTKNGVLKQILRLPEINDNREMSVGATSDGGFAFVTSNDTAYTIFKTDKNLRIKWKREITAESRVYENMPKIAVNENGNIFVAGNMGQNITFPDGQTDSTVLTGRYYPSQVFLAAFSKKGKLLWHKTLGQRLNTSLLSTKDNVYIGGDVDTDFFGKTADTTNQKNKYAASFDKKGKLLWFSTYSGVGYSNLAVDSKYNLYISNFKGYMIDSYEYEPGSLTGARHITK